MQDGELKGREEVDTLRVALLGFSLISIIILFLSLFYVFLDFAATHGGLLSDNSDISVALLNIFRKLLIVVLILPQVISLIVWVSMPPFIKRWYNLQPLPSEYTHVYGLVQEIASKMGISPPKILYTQKKVANCFNLGRTEWESTIVMSKWLVDHLNSDELKAVLIHEMAHTKNRDVTLMAYFTAVRRVTFLFPLFFLLGLLYIPLPFDSSPLWWLEVPELLAFLFIFSLYLIFGCILIIFGIQWFSRLREIAADAQVSLFIDKNILKMTLYKLACARSIQMLFISSCLMVSGTKRGGGIFSTHPSLHERYMNLNKKRFIIDTSRSPPLRFCFTTALSIFLFTTFINLLVSLPFVFIEWETQIMWLSFLLPVITAGLLFFYYPYLSIKYIGVMIILITVIGSVVYFGLMLYAYVNSLIFSSSTQGMPPGAISIMNIAVPENVDFIATITLFLRQRILFAILTFLITVFLRLTKKVYKTWS
jgi:Zn-dependent protease with chaperone function